MRVPGASKLLDFAAKHAPANSLRVWCQRAKGVKIGSDVYLGYDVNVDQAMSTLIEIEDHARIGPGVIIMAHSRPADAWLPYMGERCAPVLIKRHAAVYPGAILMPGVTVGEYAIVRAGTVVEEDVPPFAVVAGVPGRVIEMLPRDKLTDAGRMEAMSPT